MLKFCSFVLIVLLIGCTDQPNNTTQKTDTAGQHADSTIQNTPPAKDVTDNPPVKVEDSTEAWLKPGKHSLTLHWISWDYPGSVTITPADSSGWYNIKGEQRSRTDSGYLTIQGKVKPISAKELRFAGTITSAVETVNDGKPCTREGEQIFLSTKGRKYWRLQNMLNCIGDGTVDYIDIYF